MLLALLECPFHSLCIVVPDTFSIGILFQDMTVMLFLATLTMVALHHK